ncbi:MAG: RpiB/LacA/LacB family sugar-phosphate isomerase [Spirochaetia bacterium]|jgi:ribose 5-phosphate isomerase RpiB
MRIALVTEVSTKEKNASVLSALENRGHEVFNLGMKGGAGEPELTYIQTGFLGALLLGGGCVDLVVGGCGTGQGFLNSVLQYPGVCCGLIESPLDAWLFAQINGGNCISLVLNKSFGWAGEVNVRFIFDHLFSVAWGVGYPAHRKESQQRSQAVLRQVSCLTHLPLPQIVERAEESVVRPALSFPGVIDFLAARASPEVRAACLKRHGAQ